MENVIELNTASDVYISTNSVYQAYLLKTTYNEKGIVSWLKYTNMYNKFKWGNRSHIYSNINMIPISIVQNSCA